MFKSTFLGAQRLCYAMILVAVIVFYGFSWYNDRQETINWSDHCLFYAYDSSGEVNLKKWDISLTNDAFIRFRKTYLNGRQEYFSFNLRRFKNMDYLGTTTRGTIRFKTMGQDIIVQTYNDRKGNVDSMSTTLSIPVKNMEAERLDSLYNALAYLKKLR